MSEFREWGTTQFREKLADLCHRQWSGWMEYLFSKCVKEDNRPYLIIPTWAVKRWTNQINTPYGKLSDPEMESDRTEADKFLKLIDEREESLQKSLAEKSTELEQIKNKAVKSSAKSLENYVRAKRAETELEQMAALVEKKDEALKVVKEQVFIPHGESGFYSIEKEHLRAVDKALALKHPAPEISASVKATVWRAARKILDELCDETKAEAEFHERQARLLGYTTQCKEHDCHIDDCEDDCPARIKAKTIEAGEQERKV